jgi:hypothetical protein
MLSFMKAIHLLTSRLNSFAKTMLAHVSFHSPVDGLARVRKV